MVFANEYISKADVAKYGIEEFDLRHRIAHYKPNWTIDRERDVYLRYMHSGREQNANRVEFCIYFKGVLILVKVDVEGGGKRGGEQWSHYKMRQIDIPDEVKPQQEEIISALKDALIAYKGGGVYASATNHTVTFDF